MDSIPDELSAFLIDHLELQDIKNLIKAFPTILKNRHAIDHATKRRDAAMNLVLTLKPIVIRTAECTRRLWSIAGLMKLISGDGSAFISYLFNDFDSKGIDAEHTACALEIVRCMRSIAINRRECKVQLSDHRCDLCKSIRRYEFEHRFLGDHVSSVFVADIASSFIDSIGPTRYLDSRCSFLTRALHKCSFCPVFRRFARRSREWFERARALTRRYVRVRCECFDSKEIFKLIHEEIH